MKVATFVFYPLVASTKMSWPGSNYPGRWLMFVCMPVGTLWILSIIFCCSSLSCGWRGRSGSDGFRYKIRFWLLEIWLSSLPLITNLLPVLFDNMISSIWKYTHGKVPGRQDGNNATIAYFSHVLYLASAPVYYFWIGELSSHRTPRRVINGTLWTLVVDSTHRQIVGTAICVIYYMGIVTPASIVAGLNVNLLLSGDGPNFRIHYVTKWFFYGCGIRIFLRAAKFALEMVRRRVWPNGNGDEKHTTKRRIWV